MTEPNADQETEDARKVLPPPPFTGRREPDVVEPQIPWPGADLQIPGPETDPDR